MALNEGIFPPTGRVTRSRPRPRLRLLLRDRSLFPIDSQRWHPVCSSLKHLASFDFSLSTPPCSSLTRSLLLVKTSHITAALPTIPRKPTTPTTIAAHFAPPRPCWWTLTAPRTMATVEARSEMLKIPMSTNTSLRCCLTTFSCDFDGFRVEHSGISILGRPDTASIGRASATRAECVWGP